MKEQELRELSECCVCMRKIGELPLPMFHKITMERHGLSLPAVSRQQGLAMLLGGDAVLAAAMGPNEDMTVKLDETTTMVCEDCMLGRLPPSVFQAYYEEN